MVEKVGRKGDIRERNGRRSQNGKELKRSAHTNGMNEWMKRVF